MTSAYERRSAERESLSGEELKEEVRTPQLYFVPSLEIRGVSERFDGETGIEEARGL